MLEISIALIKLVSKDLYEKEKTTFKATVVSTKYTTYNSSS
jgi:hypothetical protein